MRLEAVHPRRSSPQRQNPTKPEGGTSVGEAQGQAPPPPGGAISPRGAEKAGRPLDI